MELYKQYYPKEYAVFEATVPKEKQLSYFEPRIQFGTAGLREICQLGTRYMNGITVIQMAQGLLRWHLEKSTKKTIVVGHDHRYYSEEFAALIANCFLNAGYKVYWLGQCATPLTSFCSAHYNSIACMVTASHNPKEYNGVKIYMENGCQLVNPYDKEISGYILKDLSIQVFDKEVKKEYSYYFEKAMDLYIKCCLETSLCLPPINELSIVYTPIHGVGFRIVQQTLSSVLPQIKVSCVQEQQVPDPDFPSVAFPNPEEVGALDLAIKTAKENNISIIIANDPDVDRLALAEINNNIPYIFSGDQLGALLGYWLIKNSRGDKRCVVSTVVSSHLFTEMAKSFNIHTATCLTGFKWIASTCLDLDSKDYKLVLAYEEALGYMVGNFPTWSVKDKDGVRSMVVLLSLVSFIKQQNKSVLQFLDDIYTEFGYFGNCNSYISCTDPSKISLVINSIRKWSCGIKFKEFTYPSELGPFTVTEIQDLNTGFHSTAPNQTTTLPIQSSPMLQFTFKVKNTDHVSFTGAWMTIRASGTEPKLKYYIEVAGKGKDLNLVKKCVDEKAKEMESLVLTEWLHDLK